MQRQQVATSCHHPCPSHHHPPTPLVTLGGPHSECPHSLSTCRTSAHSTDWTDWHQSCMYLWLLTHQGTLLICRPTTPPGQVPWSLVCGFPAEGQAPRPCPGLPSTGCRSFCQPSGTSCTPPIHSLAGLPHPGDSLPLVMATLMMISPAPYSRDMLPSTMCLTSPLVNHLSVSQVFSV